MEKIYNKLVRDNIPKIIIDDNKNPIIRILDDEEYKYELEKKLLEEYNEVIATKNSDDRIEELADMLEVIKFLAYLEGKDLNDIINVANAKCKKRGGFEKRIFLERVMDNE